jgi:putative endonuclease
MRKEKHGTVYIATNQRNTVLYTGVTTRVFGRIGDHQEKICRNSFSAKYNIEKLVYYETYDLIIDAIAREKQIKGYRRQKKIDLINSINPGWKDLLIEHLKSPVDDLCLNSL